VTDEYRLSVLVFHSSWEFYGNDIPLQWPKCAAYSYCPNNVKIHSIFYVPFRNLHGSNLLEYPSLSNIGNETSVCVTLSHVMYVTIAFWFQDYWKHHVILLMVTRHVHIHACTHLRYILGVWHKVEKECYGICFTKVLHHIDFGEVCTRSSIPFLITWKFYYILWISIHNLWFPVIYSC
jgi:hypothetical protein